MTASSFPRLRSEEHRVETRLRLELEHIPYGNGVCLATLTPRGRDDLDIGILDNRAVHVICVRRRRVVDALVKIAHANDIASSRDQLGHVSQKLSLSALAAVAINEVR